MQASAEPQHVVDASALAESIVNKVFDRMPVQQAAPVAVAQRASIFQDTAERFLKDGKMDADVMPVMVDLIKAGMADMTAAQREEQAKIRGEERGQQIQSELGRMVDRFAESAKNPELISELKHSIIQKAYADYNANPSLVNRFHADGSIDWKVFEKSVVAQVTKWNGAGGAEPAAKPAGGPAMKNSAPAGTPEGSSSLSVDSLTEKQRELFNSQMSFGKKEMRLTPEAAQKRALDNISRAEEKLKSSKSRS